MGNQCRDFEWVLSKLYTLHIQQMAKSHDLEAARNLASTEEFQVAYLVLTYAAKALSTVRERCTQK